MQQITDLPLDIPVTSHAIWPLDPQVTFLNHGSFGSCPRPVLQFQQNLRDRLEREPVDFLVRELEPMLDEARAALAQFVGSNPDDLVFVPNATAGVNTVLRSLSFQPGDEILTTDHVYNACRNALVFAAEKAGARVVVAHPPFPFQSAGQLSDAIESGVTAKTRLALLDHVTSPTGVVFPLERIVERLTARGIETLVDGAHSPGMIELNLHRIGATYYTGNCHKWICAPKGAAFLSVARHRQALIRPLIISHGANSSRTDRSRFLTEFAWTGTVDPTAFLSVPEAIRFMESSVAGGWPAIRRRNHALALAGRARLCSALNISVPCPADCVGALASLPIPDAPTSAPPLSPLYLDPVQERLRTVHRIEVPIIPWPNVPKRLLRVSAQLYNALPDYDKLAAALPDVLSTAQGGASVPANRRE